MTDTPPATTFDLIDTLAIALAEKRGDHRGAISSMAAELSEHAQQTYKFWLDWCINGDDNNQSRIERDMRRSLADLACMTLELVQILGGDPDTELQLSAREVLTNLDTRK